MDLEMMTILANKGLGKVLFGMNRKDVTAILGEPDEKENDGVEEEEEYQVEAWHYDDLGLSLQFDQEHGWRLVTMAVSETDYLVEGLHLIGMNRLELINSMDKLNFGEVVFEDDSDEENANFLTVCALDENMNFWLEDDCVTEIQWGPDYNEDTEQIIWP